MKSKAMLVKGVYGNIAPEQWELAMGKSMKHISIAVHKKGMHEMEHIISNANTHAQVTKNTPASNMDTNPATKERNTETSKYTEFLR